MNPINSTLTHVPTVAFHTAASDLEWTVSSVGSLVRVTFEKSFHSRELPAASLHDQSNVSPHEGQGMPGMKAPSKKPQCGHIEVKKSSIIDPLKMRSNIKVLEVKNARKSD